MDFITLTKDNIESEHICCAFSDKKSTEGYKSKKQWLKNQIEDGYVFTKLNERAKVFIEYAPSEIAYLPINAPNYMVINCFWVSGKYKGNGYGKELLEKCIEDSKKKGKDGIVVLCGDKKRPYMADKKFFLKHGFEKCDTAKPYFELLYLKLTSKDTAPKFLESVRNAVCEDNDGFKVYYSNQCPYINYYMDLQFKIAQEQGYIYEKVLIDSKDKSIKNPSPFTIYSLFYKGKFITQEIATQKKFQKIIEEVSN